MSERAKHLIARLAEIRRPPAWRIFTEVRSITGVAGELRRADAVAFNYYPRGTHHEIDGFEVKEGRDDWVREREDPAKSGAIARYCRRWYVVVPAPYKDILQVGELLEGQGLIEVGTGKPRIVHEVERDVQPPSPRFVASLMQAAGRQRPLEATRPGPRSTWPEGPGRRLGGAR